MKRIDFHKLFKQIGPVVLPVIHVKNIVQVFNNIDKIVGEGAPGCFLINHDFGIDDFLPIIKKVRIKFPSLWLSVNFLAETGKVAFPILSDLSSQGCFIDGYWGDDACIDENGVNIEAKIISKIRNDTGWKGLYFGGTAFKKQRIIPQEKYGDAAKYATQFMDVVTTSGVATGIEADISKIKTFRSCIGDSVLAIASGITVDNAKMYSIADCFMVATGINYENDFYEIDHKKLSKLLLVCRQIGIGE